MTGLVKGSFVKGSLAALAIGAAGALALDGAVMAQTAPPTVAVADPAPAPAPEKVTAKKTKHAGPVKHARRSYDGYWSVSIVTQSGPCDAGIRYPIQIIGGAVRSAGAAVDAAISGFVGASGGVRVSVSRAGHAAYGSGRLSGSYGSGRWQAPSAGCYGTWSASRRG